MAALKTIKEWIRWKYLGFALGFLIVLAIFCLVFLDPLVKRAIENLGTKVAGAKVEVESVNVSLFKTSVQIQGMQVADRSDPMKNLIEFHKAAFNYALEPLLSKKLIVQEMTMEGLRWGTPRKKSGEVRQNESPSVFRKMAEKVTLPKFDGKDIRKTDWRSMTDPDKLSSVKIASDIKNKAEDIKSQWQDKIDHLEIQPTVDQVKSGVQEAQDLKISGPEDIPKAKKTLDDLKKSQDILKAKLTEVKSIEQALGKEMADVKTSLSSADLAERRDVQDIMGRLKLPDLSPKGLARSIFGPLWLDRLDKAKYWVDRSRKAMPSKEDLKKVKEEPKPRREGLTVRFPGMKAWPKFLFEKISLSGTSAKKPGEANAIDFSGQVLGVTSEPAIYGKPMTLDLNGARGALALSLKGLLDHRGDISKDDFTLSARGIDLAGRTWQVPEFLPSVTESGTGSADFRFGMTGQDLNASLTAGAKGLKLGGAKETDNNLERVLQKAISKISVLNVTAGAQGIGDNLDFTIGTNLDDILASQVKSLVGEEAGKLKSEIEARVHEVVGGRKAEASQAVEEAQKDTLGKLSQKTLPLNNQQNLIQGLIGKLETQILGQAGGGLKNKIPGGLKDIFK